MFSNLEMKPIQPGREDDETGKGLAELFVASADSPHALDAGEEILDDVTVSVEQFRVEVLDIARATRGNAGFRTDRGQFATKGSRIEATITNHPAISQHADNRRNGPQVVAIAWCDAQACRATKSVDRRRQLRVRATLGPSDSLSGGSTRGIGKRLDGL